MRTGLLVAVLCLSVGANALADSPKPVDVPAGDLIVALELLEKQSGVEVVYRPELLQGLHTEGVKGVLFQAAQLDPSYAEPHFVLARLYRRLGQNELSRRETETYLRLHHAADCNSDSQ